jgi:ABC-type glycerol-3-phosphate transport system substrate-binding protein
MNRKFFVGAALMGAMLLTMSSCGGNSKSEPSVAEEKADMTETFSNTYSEPESD